MALYPGMRVLLASFIGLLFAGLALAGPATKVDRAVYGNAVRLIEKLYLYPDEVQPHDLLRSAARGLMNEIDWLMVESSDTDVTLLHGDGTAIGMVSVGSWEGLPDALHQLERLVLGSGHPVGAVDVRLELLKGLTSALDRYSRVLHGEGKERFEIRLSGEYEGIGATLDRRDGRLMVVDVLPDGPAERAGLRARDAITRIDGKSTVSLPRNEAVRLVRGEVGTQVVLTVDRGGEPQDIAITRARVTEPNVRWRVLDDQVGYVRITHISQRTVENLQNALARLREAGALERGLVVDLRGNTGGSMKEAARSADMFLTEGLLLRTEGPDGGRVQNLQAEMRAEGEGDEPPIPVVIVVDERTASGSEIFAGALVELERAAIVGTRTYGKGTVQKIYSLDGDTQLKLTIAQYVLANKRLIADVGIVPDVVVGRVELNRYGVRFHDFDEGAQRTTFADILPHVVERNGWRELTEGEEAGTRVPDRDLPVEIARRAVLRTQGTQRADVLASLQAVAAEARAEQESFLIQAFEQRQIDWSPAEEEGTFVDAAVRLTAQPSEHDKDTYTVRVEVENREEVPLHRALVELDCSTLRAWDNVVIPVGRVAPGEIGHGEVLVPLPPGVDPREDVVTVRLRADRRPPLVVGDEVLAARSSPLPRLSVTARLVPHPGGLHRAEVTIHNLAAHPISGIEAKFAYPFGLDVELVDMMARIPVLPAKGSERLDLTLSLGDDAPAVLPLDLEIQAERYRTLASWPLSLPVDGAEVTLQSPEIKLRHAITSAPVGRIGLPLVVTDDRKLDHAVVYANGRKIAWVPGGRSTLELRPEVDLFAGVNRILVVAEDDQGLRERHWLFIRGEPRVSVDAEP